MAEQFLLMNQWFKGVLEPLYSEVNERIQTMNTSLIDSTIADEMLAC